MGNVLSAFGEEHAERLTGVTKHQLRYWNREGFFRPSFDGGDWDSSVVRVYSFADIVSLKVLGLLRNKHNVSLQHLRSVKEKLNQQANNERWAAIRFFVLNRRVIWHEPGTELPQEIASGQYVVPAVELEVVVSDAKKAIKAMSARDNKDVGRVERSRYVNHNDPVIAGTRIRVMAIKRYSAAGYSSKQIRQEYPDLTERDIRAALEYGDAHAAA